MTVNQNKLFFFHMLLLVMVFYRSNKKVANIEVGTREQDFAMKNVIVLYFRGMWNFGLEEQLNVFIRM